jgi:hypothetical protein
VVGYEGRPSGAQLERTAAIAREVGDVDRAFTLWITTRLPALNAALKARSQPPIGPVP